METHGLEPSARSSSGASATALLEGGDISGVIRTHWLCEKWEQDKIEFAQRELERLGISHIQDGYELKPVLGLRDKVASRIAGRDLTQVVLVPKLIPVSHGVTSDWLRKLLIEPDAVEEREGNLLLNEGIQQMLDLMIAALNNQTAGNAYNNGSSYIGVGDSSTAEAATQTELQAATNRFYKGMVATYPQRTNQQVDWRSDFTTTEANYTWAEWSVSAGATTASGAGFTTGTKNLNRKVQSLGSKTTGTWTLTASITFS